MKIIKSIGLSLLVLTGTLLNARGEPYRTNINPALLYYQAFLLAPSPMSAADWDYLGSKAGRSQNFPSRFDKIFSSYDNQFKMVCEAVHATQPCDWGIDQSAGPATLLPHLAKAKAVVVAAQMRAIWHLQHGRQAAARNDLLGAFVLARNTARDSTLIGVLVQQALEAIVYSTLADNFGEFTPTTLKQLDEGFKSAPSFISVASAMDMEKTNGPDFWKHKIEQLRQANPGNNAKVMDDIRASFERSGLQYSDYDTEKPDTNFWQKIVVASGGTSEGVLKLVREIESLYPRLAKILSLPPNEFAEQIKKFDAQVKQLRNPLIPALFPEPLRPQEREFKIRAWEAMFQAAVEYKLHGKEGLKSVPDPFGNGPFIFKRFVFQGVDRGFELKSAYAGLGYPCALIFVEKTGTPFHVEGPYIGQAIE